MNQPSYSTFEVLQQLKTSFITSDDISNLLPSIFNAFNTEQDINVLSEIVSVILGLTEQAVPFRDLERVILHPFLPLVKQYISKILSTIHDELQESIFENVNLQEIKRKLEICATVLNDINTFLSYVVGIYEVTVSNIRSVPKNVADIVLEIFEHCQKSKELYKEAFLSVRNELMSLFQTCHKVHLNLFVLLNEKLSFNCEYESELQLLIDTMEILASMAEVVADLDTLSLVAHWKGYALLTQTYAIHLRCRLDIDRPVVYLTANISHQLSTLSKAINNEKKAILRLLKITSLQLKVLIKLCEHFKGYLGECHMQLLDCLITLSFNTTNFLKQQGVPLDIVSQVTTQLSAGAAPLITHLISDPLFIKEYLLFVENIQDKSLLVQAGYCQLTSLILKKLVHLCSKDEEIHNQWNAQNLPIINVLFRLLHECFKEDLTAAYQEDIYQSLLVNTTGFLVINCTADMFAIVERYLFQHLLQPSLWPAVFSSDLMCLVARFGSSDLCQQLTCLLSNMLTSWPIWDRHRPEWVYVCWTTGRLTQLLSSEHLKHFKSGLQLNSTIATNLSILLRPPFSEEKSVHFQSWVKTSILLAEFMYQFPDVSSNLTETLYELWECFAAPVEIDSPESTHWLYGIYSCIILTTCAISSSLSNIQVLNILDVLTKLTSQKVSLFTCGACEFLQTLSTKTFANDPMLPVICHKVSSLFVQLMDSEDPVAKSFALETFSFFAYLTKYEQIVADTVANDIKLQAEITNYLEDIPIGYPDEDFQSKSFTQTFLHKCTRNNTKKINSDLEYNPSKKLKVSLDDDLFVSALQRIEDGVTQLEKVSIRSDMSISDLSRLNVIVTRLNRIIK